MKRYRGCSSPQFTAQCALTEIWCHVLKAAGIIRNRNWDDHRRTGPRRVVWRVCWRSSNLLAYIWLLKTTDWYPQTTDQRSSKSTRRTRKHLLEQMAPAECGRGAAEPRATPGMQRTRQNGRLGEKRLAVEAVRCVISLPNHLMMPYRKCYRRHGYVLREPT